APGAAGIGGDAADQGGAVEQLDGAVGLGAAGQRQRVVAGDAVAGNAGVGGVRGDGRGRRRSGVDGDGERAGGGAHVAGGIGGGGGEVVGAVGEGGGGVAPGAAGIGGDAADQGGAVEQLDGAVGLGAAGQRQRVVAGDAVAGNAGVGGVRGDGRGRRRSGVDGDGERAGGGAHVAGG